jgi:alkaline phosphatase D
MKKSSPLPLLNRRDWGRAALGLALAPWSLPVVQAMGSVADAQRPVRWQNDPFSLGVASGQPRADSVILWTRLMVQEADAAHTAHPLAVLCEVFADEALRKRVGQWTVLTQAQRGMSVHVEAKGLQPGRTYWYRFVCGSATSPVGRTRTTPALQEKVQALRMVLASCQHFEQGYFTAHRDIAQQDVDFVLFVGDYIYESTNPRFLVRQHQGGVPQTLDQYRARHAQYKGDADLRAAHAAHPWVMTWDDHEVVNDYANDRDTKYTDPVVFLRRRAAAYQAYFEHMPVRLGPDAAHPANMRIHDRMAWGQLAEIWTLDNRQYRTYQACPDPLKGGGRVVMGCNELLDPQRSMLGLAQERWLTEGLNASQRAWKMVAQGTQMSSSGLATPLGRSSFTDGWDGYPLARERFLQNIVDAKLQDVLVLGGDVHMNVAAQLRVKPNDEQSPVVASELVTTSLTSRGLGDTMVAQIRSNNSDIAHIRADERGYTLLQVTPEGVQSEFRTSPHPVQPASVFTPQARFAVQRGVAGVVKL